MRVLRSISSRLATLVAGLLEMLTAASLDLEVAFELNLAADLQSADVIWLAGSLAGLLVLVDVMQVWMGNWLVLVSEPASEHVVLVCFLVVVIGLSAAEPAAVVGVVVLLHWPLF